jgi:signal transduction histidine kinase
MTLRASTILTVPLLAMLVWSLFSGLNGQGPALDRAAADLSDFTLHENALHRDLLSARAGLLRNFDPVNQAVALLDADLSRLRATGIVNNVAGELALLAARQEDLVEPFKSQNALLQNGLAYFSLFSDRLQTPATSGTLTQAANSLSAAMLQLTLDTSPETGEAVDRRLAFLAAQPVPSESSDAVAALLAYGGLLRHLLPETDTLLKDLLAMPFAAEETKAADLIAASRQAERQRAVDFHILLYVTSFLLLAQVAHFGVQLQRRRLVAQRRAAFERAVASLSVRFINCGSGELPELVHQALAELAGLTNADRAYCLISGTSTQTYAWAREGVRYPPGWPQNAAELVRRLPPSEHGVIHVADRQSLTEESARQMLTDAGIYRWTCIASDGQDRLSCLLGLDSLRAEQHGHASEVRLLRIAFDAIANAVSRDILSRERAQLERSVQRARQVETIAALTGGVAHNFNNIVGIILGYAEMIDETSAPPGRLTQQVSGIRQAAERARTLIEQILGYGTKRDTRRSLIDMRSLLTETLDQLALSLPQTVAILPCEMPDRAAAVAGEPAQLQQVIMNLCNNAAQAMDNQGEVTVALDLQELVQERRLSHGRLTAGRFVRLVVSDRGRGMGPEILDRIFEPFFTTRAAGNGLGLATVRNIIQDHGGALHVESTPGTGSRFEAWMPRADVTQGTVSDLAGPQQFGHGETVLLLTDDPARLLHEEDVIAALGYEPVGFFDSVQMCSAIQAAPDRFDVAVLSLSDLSAQAEAVRSLGRILPRIPIIVMTAALNKLEADYLTPLQGCVVVPRSPNLGELAAALCRTLERGKQHRSTVDLCE